MAGSGCGGGGFGAVGNAEEPADDLVAAVSFGDKLERRVVVDVDAVPEDVPLVQYVGVLRRLVRVCLGVIESQQTAVVVLETAVTVAEQLTTYRHRSGLLSLATQCVVIGPVSCDCNPYTGFLLKSDMVVDISPIPTKFSRSPPYPHHL